MPEPAIVQERLGEQFLDGVGGRCRGHQHDVGTVPERSRAFFQRLEPGQPRKQVRRGEFRRALDDLAHHRMHLVGVFLEERPDRRQPFRDPGSVVEQRRGFQERGEVELHRLAAEALQPVHGFVECVHGVGVAVEFERRRQRERESLRQRPGGQLELARPGVARIVAAQHVEHGDRIRHGERENRHAIQRLTGRHNAPCADEAAARLQSDDVVQPGRHPARTRGIGAERKAGAAARDGDGRPGTRPAGDVFFAERIGHGAVWRPRAHQPGGELVQVGLADQDGAGGFELLHHRGGARGNVGERGTGRGGRQAGDVDVVLDRVRNAVQRQARKHAGVVAQHLLELPGAPGERVGRHPGDPGAGIGVVVRRTQGFDHFGRLALAEPVIGEKRRDGHGHCFPPCCILYTIEYTHARAD